MAKETKSMTVLPSEEQWYIDVMQCFGWEVVSSQEIYEEHEQQKTIFGYSYSDKKTTNYVKLVFSRDTNIKNYREIVQLERERDSVLQPRRKKVRGMVIFGILLMLLQLGCSGLPQEIAAPVAMALEISGSAMIVLAIILFFVRKRRYNKEVEECEDRIEEIALRARALLEE